MSITKFRSWMFAAGVTAALVYLASRAGAVSAELRILFDHLSNPAVTAASFHYADTWPLSDSIARSPSAADRAIANIVLDRLERADTNVTFRSDVIAAMNEHGVNPSWYRWMRPTLVQDSLVKRRLDRVDDSWLLSHTVRYRK